MQQFEHVVVVVQIPHREIGVFTVDLGEELEPQALDIEVLGPPEIVGDHGIVVEGLHDRMIDRLGAHGEIAFEQLDARAVPVGQEGEPPDARAGGLGLGERLVTGVDERGEVRVEAVGEKRDVGDAERLVLRRVGSVQQLDHAARKLQIDDIRVRRRDQPAVDDSRPEQSLVEGERLLEIANDDAEVVQFVDHGAVPSSGGAVIEERGSRSTRRPSSADR